MRTEYETCRELKKLGFPQLKYEGACYLDEAGKHVFLLGENDPINVGWSYRPTPDDILNECVPVCQQIIQLATGGFVAHAAYVGEGSLKATSDTFLGALVFLWIAIKSEVDKK